MRANKIGEEVFLTLLRAGYFTIDEQGRFWRKGKRAEHRTPAGYLQLRVMVAGVRYHTGAHRIVWRWFRGEIPEGHIVHHHNGLKDDNRPGNLGAITGSENQRHAFEVGLADQYGERNPKHKLTDKQVAHIRHLYASGEWTQQQLADRFGVAFQTISKIVRGDRRIMQRGPVDRADHRHNTSGRNPMTGRFASKKHTGVPAVQQ